MIKDILTTVVSATPQVILGIIVYNVVALFLEKISFGKRKNTQDYFRGAFISIGIIYSLVLTKAFLPDVSLLKGMLITATSAAFWVLFMMPLSSVWYWQLPVIKRVALACLLFLVSLTAVVLFILVNR